MSDKCPNVIKINNTEYVKKESLEPAKQLDSLDYVIVRTYSAGVFAGYLKSRKDREVVLLDARRIWYWDGAASLSQLAMEGTKAPQNCKFPREVEKVELLEAIEILYCTEDARISICNVLIWKQ
jgi:hypothetical protein